VVEVEGREVVCCSIVENSGSSLVNAGPRIGSSIIRALISSVVLAGFAIRFFLLYAIEPPPEVSYTLVSRVYPRAGTRGHEMHFAIDNCSIRKIMAKRPAIAKVVVLYTMMLSRVALACVRRELNAPLSSSQSRPLRFVIGTVPFRPNYSHINSPQATRFQSPL
jgi:hypothetical protein